MMEKFKNGTYLGDLARSFIEGMVQALGFAVIITVIFWGVIGGVTKPLNEREQPKQTNEVTK